MTVVDLLHLSSGIRVRRNEPRAADWARRLRMMLLRPDGAAAAAGVTAWLLCGGRLVWVTLLVPSWIAAMLATRTYEDSILGHGAEEFEAVGKAGVVCLLVAGMAAFVSQDQVPRAATAAAVVTATAVSAGGRLLLRKRVHTARKAGQFCKRVLVVGDVTATRTLIEQLSRDVYHGYVVVGACLLPSPDALVPAPRLGRDDLHMSTLGRVEDAVRAVRVARADVVAVISSPELSGSTLRELSWALERTSAELVVAPGIMEVAGPRLHIRPIAELPLLHVEEPRFSGGVRAVKTAVDRVGAAVGLFLLSPLFVGIALAVRHRGGEGGVFFRQTRIGLHGEEFTMLKFRTMVKDAESMLVEIAELDASNGVLFKAHDDPRITGVGRWLRRYSLDELPQLVNVLRGDMSLVGPRPPLLKEVEQYGPDMRRRLLVKPGLTGLWQVSGRSDLSWEETVRLDLRYVENWSLGLDAYISYKTASAVFRGHGAY